MKRVASIVTAIVVCFGALQAAPDQSSDKPQYTSDNKLLPPKNFREWIFLSSGLGMSYRPAGRRPPDVHECLRAALGLLRIPQERQMAGPDHVRRRRAQLANQRLD